MTHTTRVLVIGAMLLSMATPSAAQSADDGASGWITPTFTFFDFSKGSGSDLTQVLEKYDYLRGLGDNRRTGVLLDVGDLRFAQRTDGREQWLVERWAGSYDNHRGFVRFDTDGVRLRGGYAYLRTAVSGVNFLYSPNRVPGGTDPQYSGGTVGFFRTFNDDSGESLYRVGRTTFGAEATLKPTLLNDFGTIALAYTRTNRSGNRFAPYVLGGGDTQGDADGRAQLRWRAYDREVDEAADLGSLRFTLSPKGAFVFDYHFTVDKFDTKTIDYTLSDVTSGIGFGTPTPPPSFTAGRDTLPLNYIPDSSLLTNRLALTKRFGKQAVVSAGAAKSVLDQDSFVNREIAAGFNKGRITSETAYAAANVKFTPRFGVEARGNVAKRTNDSIFPVPGFFDPNSSFTQPRLDEMTRSNLSVEATYYPNMARTSIAAGWKREGTDRDLTYGVGRGIPPQRSLYGEETELDSYYVRFVTRPAKGVNVRARAAFISGDKTALITEPEKGTDLNVSIGYTVPNGVMVSGFYGLRDRSNDLLAFVGGPAPGPNATAQKRDATFQSVGFVGAYAPSERGVFTFNYTWAQTDLNSNFISTNIRRFDQSTNVTAIVFALREAEQTTIDSHTFEFGGDARASDKVRISAHYLITAARGDAASGTVLAALPTQDGRIDNTLHGLDFSTDFELQGGWIVRGSYFFDYYSDAAFSELTGGLHTVALGLVFRF